MNNWLDEMNEDEDETEEADELLNYIRRRRGALEPKSTPPPSANPGTRDPVVARLSAHIREKMDARRRPNDDTP